MVKLSDVIERKFVDSIDIDPEEWEIETESGWVDICILLFLTMD